MRIILDLPPEQAARVVLTLGGEDGARRLLLRILGSVLDAAQPNFPALIPSDTLPEVPAAMSLAGDPIRGETTGAILAESREIPEAPTRS